MKKKRLIPILLLQNGNLVQSKGFNLFQNLGNPVDAVKRLSEWGSDELIYLDISRNNIYDTNRDDLKYKNNLDFLSIIKEVSKVTFMPITIGGKIKNLKDVEKRFKVGADKVAVNSAALNNPKLINMIAKEFGSQCLVISIDVKLIKNKYQIFFDGGRKISHYNLEDWIDIAVKNGAGEILINSIDRDGSKKGYDIKLLNIVQKKSQVPVIACGGVGNWSHFYEGLTKSNVDAVAAANIFHHIDQSVYLSKKFLYEKKINIRKPDLLVI
jgi:imidazole glycerol-phosphate synthase subunit HisF